MEITEVRIKLMEESEDRLRAFCSITIDNCFVVRDLKIIEGSNGPFVAMPSRKLTERCPKCGYKNHMRSNFCNQCGGRIRAASSSREGDANANKLYADIAHPINQGCRDIIQQAVVTEYQAELERAKLPGYISRYDDEYSETTKSVDIDTVDELTAGRLERPDAEVGPEDVQLRIDTGDEQAKADEPHFKKNDGRPNRENVDSRNDQSGFGQGILDGDS